MKNKYLLACVLELSLNPIFCHATLGNVEDQKAVMEAQIELLKKQADLNAALRALGQVAGEVLPSVVSIGSRGPESFARLMMPNGTSFVFKPGERINKRLSLASIEDKTVWVHIEESGMAKKLMRLEFTQVSSSELDTGIGKWNSNLMTPSALPKAPLPPMSSMGFLSGSPSHSNPSKDSARGDISPSLEDKQPQWMSRRAR